MPVPTALYRHFDAEGELLYVGISLNAVARLSQHRKTARWFRAIARIEVEWHPTRTAAERAERTAIVAEAPKHNVAHAPGMSPALWGLIKDHPWAKYVMPNGWLAKDCPPLTLEEVEAIADRL